MDYISVLWIILSSGSLYFGILRPKLSFLGLIIIATSYLLKNKSLKIKNLKIFVIVTLIILIQSVACYRNGFNLNEAILIIGRLFLLAIIQSSIEERFFKKSYIDIMVVISIISLICFFIITQVGYTNLPFLSIEFQNKSIYILTPYYTLGWGIKHIFSRNAALFWEPGAFQIFANLAILFLVSSKGFLSKAKKKKDLFQLLILVIAILTTMSATGYMCLVAVLIYALFSNNKKKIKIQYKVLIIIALFSLYLVEDKLGIITNKVVNQEGSYTTRYVDTTTGYLLAFRNPILGLGGFNTAKSELLKNYGINYISNGLASFFMSWGVPITIGYLTLIWKRMKKMLACNNTSMFIVALILLMFFNSESVLPFPIFMSFIFPWKKVNVKKRIKIKRDLSIG